MSARSRSLLNIFETTSGMKMMIDYSQIAGADHMPTFKCTVHIEGHDPKSGYGPSKKKAMHHACDSIVEYLIEKKMMDEDGKATFHRANAFTQNNDTEQNIDSQFSKGQEQEDSFSPSYEKAPDPSANARKQSSDTKTRSTFTSSDEMRGSDSPLRNHSEPFSSPSQDYFQGRTGIDDELDIKLEAYDLPIDLNLILGEKPPNLQEQAYQSFRNYVLPQALSIDAEQETKTLCSNMKIQIPIFCVFQNKMTSSDEAYKINDAKKQAFAKALTYLKLLPQSKTANSDTVGVEDLNIGEKG
eukprot:gene1465-4624_t